MVKIYPKDHLLQVEIWVIVNWELLFSFSFIMPWFHNMSRVCKQFIVFSLFQTLEKWHNGLFETSKHNFIVKLCAKGC